MREELDTWIWSMEMWILTSWQLQTNDECCRVGRWWYSEKRSQVYRGNRGEICVRIQFLLVQRLVGGSVVSTLIGINNGEAVNYVTPVVGRKVRLACGGGAPAIYENEYLSMDWGVTKTHGLAEGRAWLLLLLVEGSDESRGDGARAEAASPRR